MPAWKGYLQISFVAVPVRSTPAARSGTGSRISFNQLHAECHNRIRYKKVCPEHGEVPNDEIALGYEYAKGQYVIVDPDEIATLRPTSEERGIAVQTFAPAGSVNPLYLAGKDYFLTPDGTKGQQPYQLIRDAMAEAKVEAIAKAVLSNKEQLVLIRPIDRLLVMSVLEYATQIKPVEEFENELAEVKHDKQQHALARQMIDAMTSQEIDFSEFRDLYTERMTELIEAKVEGREVVAPPAGPEPQVVNLMEALKRSVAQVKRPTQGKPERKMAPSRKKPAAARKTGRRKTG